VRRVALGELFVQGDRRRLITALCQEHRQVERRLLVPAEGSGLCDRR
jgi:hypothetical protein